MGRSINRIIRLNLYAVIFTVVFFILFTITILLFLPLYLLRFLVTIVRKVFRPDLGKLVTTRSAVIAGTDDPTKDPKWILCVWLVIEGKPDFERFRLDFYNNIVLKRLPNGELHFPEFQQYLYKWLGFMFWKWEKDFSVEEHMHPLFPEDTEKIVTENELRQIIKRLTWEPFKAKKSPWEFLTIPNYQDNASQSADKGVLIFRVHHGLCDGFSILNLLLKEVANISLSDVAMPDRPKRSIIYNVLQGMFFWLSSPFLFMKMIVRTADTNEWHLPKEKICRPYNTGFTERIPLSYIKEIKNLHKVSFSAVLFSSLTGALRKAMLENRKAVPEYISTAIAVPMPGHPFKLRNHFIFSFLQLPIGMENPVERLHKIERNIKRLKQSPVPLFSFFLIPIAGGTLSSTMKLFSDNPYSTVLTSNFPGPPKVAYYNAPNGQRYRVADMNFSAGLGEGNVGIGFCMLSYAEGIRIISSFADSILETDETVDSFNDKILEEMSFLRKSLNTV